MPAVRRVAIVMKPVRQFCRGVLRGVANVSVPAGWECVVIAADAQGGIDLGGHFDGLIGHLADPALLEQVRRTGAPAVDVSSASDRSPLPRVTTDDVAVGMLAAAHLLSLGLPHLAYFGRRSDPESRLRGEGFVHAAGAAGVAGVSCHFSPNGPPDPARRADPPGVVLDDWVRRLPKPIGVLADTDSRALDLLAACGRLRIAVPGSVAVLGVDNDDVFCELANPPLSSIALSAQDIGYEAARMLERLMAGGGAEEPLLVPPAGVVQRRSTDLPGIMDHDVAAAVRFISLHVKDDLQVADVLREVTLSRRSLEQRFLKALGRTPAAEILRAQVEVARQMLRETEEPMARVALAAGFSNAKQLGTSFRHATGLTPSAYRRESRGEGR
ncbi:MAG TPA: DNA-binding transcriptional regulator [Tepidisphaeraceae bacterium]|nr:DNA-binding transcriptional regulator [Tepidisphaeraceae bacterium]